MSRKAPEVENEGAPHELTYSLTGGTTPVPTALLDKVMPTLRDTELRVLLVVVRQTLGWQVGKDPRLRKERDWLTQGQLMRRTGRAGGAVARAVDALVRRGLIDVLDGAERLLMTPAERRRCLGRLYYRLHRPEAEAATAPAKSEHAKPHTTKETAYKKRHVKPSPVEKPVENPLAVRSRGWTRVTDILPRQHGGEAPSRAAGA